MKHHYNFVRFFVLLLTAISCQTAIAQQIHEYTQEQPLVIACDWEFPPYEFRNDQGQPDGYNIDVFELILDRLKIPHRYQMEEWFQAVESFEKREADIIHALSFNYKQRPYVMTRNLLHYYRIVCIHHVDTEPLTKISQLGPNDTIVLRNNDYASSQIMLGNEHPAFTVEYHSPREALAGVRQGRYKYFFWGERPALWKMKEFAIDSLTTNEIDIPAGEFRLIGYDKELIDQIDDEYARLEQAGEIDRIRDKWFHPERVHNDSSPIALFIIIGAIITTAIGFLLSRLMISRVKAAVRKSVDLNNMMTQALSMGDYYVIEHDLWTDHIINIYGNLLPPSGMSSEEFVSRIHPTEKDEFEEILEHQHQGIITMEQKRRWNAGTPESPDWRNLHVHTIIEFEDNKPHYVVSSIKDVTHEIIEKQQNNEMAEKYMKMFETNLIAMSFYDADGILHDVNERMKDICGFYTVGEDYFRKVTLFDVPILKGDYDFNSGKDFHVCHRMYYPELGIDKYLEFRIHPVANEHGDIIFYIITSRDLTDERQMYLEQRRHDIEIRRINDEANRYETQLHYLLENSDMYVWRSDLVSQTVQFSRSLRTTDLVITLEEYVNCMDPQEQEGARYAMSSEENMSKPFNIIHRFASSPFTHQPVWFAISGMPVTDEHGVTTGQFGVIRNITNLMDAQQRLKDETARAENSGRLKSAFLANMTHEIRTPLNAIVGFSDLLPVIEEQSERMEFIRIIRNNCDMLLRLINDILEASSMGQALAIEPTEVDFAQVFDDICQTLAQRVEEPGVEFIKDNPYSTYPTILDKGRIQQVLTNFTTNAVKYTHEGHIKVGYREEERTAADGTAKNGLFLYCEDTGAGIPKDKQASVFERFVKLNDYVQGTGLGLSICKSIAERCGGQIGVTSEGEGRGSTFWLWIPCEKR